ncbi:MAG: aminodeoxychorismate lyase, partial [Pseudomonadota bacterium]
MPFTNLLKIKLFILISIAVVVICIANILGGYLLLPGNLDKEKIVIIKPRLSIHKISVLLEKENVIKNAKLFEAISRIYSHFEPLKSGEYKFTKNI